MTEAHLEQRVILVVGWLLKAERLAARETTPDASDMPPEGLPAPRAYVQEQRDLARDAATKLMRLLKRQRDSATDKARIAVHQREALAAQAATGRSAAKTVNEQARQLAEQIAVCRQEIDRCEGLLRVLRGQEEVPLPSLPLYKYAGALERLENAAVADETPAPVSSAPPPVPLHLRAYRAFQQRTDPSDRVAMAVALVLCIFVIGGGLYYVFNWGRIELQVTSADSGHLRVVCVNSTHNAILLNVPYSGGGLPREPVTHFGLLVELLDANGQVTRPDAPETLWTYKDSPTHLYGPIVIGPMFAAELLLDLSATAASPGETLRLTLFRAPARRYSVYTVRLPEGFRDGPQ